MHPVSLDLRAASRAFAPGGGSAPQPGHGDGSGAAASHWPVAILGVAFDAVTTAEALARVARMVESGRPHYIVTPNVDFLVQARRDAELRRILLEADLVLCDGTPLVWASRWLGNPLPERVAGSDLMPPLLEQAEQMGHRLFLLGAAPEVAEAAVARLRERYPALVVAGQHSPPFGPLDRMDHAAIIGRIRAARPDIVLVSFGCPKQEKWIARHHRALGVPVCIGVGAVIDFLAGRVQRAPRWMRPLGLEWLYRLAQEPRRLARRYADDLRYFAPAILAQCWRMRRRARCQPPGSAVIASQDGGGLHAQVAGRLDRAAIETAARFWRQVGDGGGDCELDLAEVGFIDSTGVALLLERRKRLREAGGRLVLHTPSTAVRQELDRLGLTELFEIGLVGPMGGFTRHAA